MTIIGRDDIAGAFDTYNSSAFLFKYQAPINGDIVSMSFYGSEFAVGAVNAVFAIYTDGGANCVRLGLSNTFVMPSADAWVTKEITATLTGGTLYWIGFFADGVGFNVYRDDSPNGLWGRATDVTWYPTPPDPLDVTGFLTRDDRATIYGLYGGGAPASGQILTCLWK